MDEQHFQTKVYSCNKLDIEIDLQTSGHVVSMEKVVEQHISTIFTPEDSQPLISYMLDFYSA